MIQVESRVDGLRDYVISKRRKLHRIPEPGTQEYKTTELILTELRQLGIEAEVNAAGTGVIGFLPGEPDSETIAFRADIDALSVEEQTGATYCSTHPGFMHACGHDGHTAILLGLAKLLGENRSLLKKNVLFIFQPAEEGPGGAEPIVKAGVLQRFGVSRIFGLHIYPEVPEGFVGCRPGAMMAQTGEFDIKITGRSCHGAMPHKGQDAIVAAANLAMAFQSVISRNIDPLEPAVVTVGRMVCGERRNIIAGEAVLEGTMRAFNEDTYNRIRGRIIKIMQSVSDAYECELEYDIRDMYPAVCNDEMLFALLESTVGKDNLELLKPLTLSEDFSYFQKQVPGLFFMLGCRNEALGHVYPLHNNRFNFNEEILLYGIQLFYNLYEASK